MTNLLVNTAPPEFSGFGPSLLVQQTRQRLRSHAVPDDRMEARALLHDHCPLTPGVYGWLDENQQICYVGKSKALRKRLLSYFAKTPSDKKTERIVEHSQRLVWEPISNELLALIREQELIYRWRPDFNKQGQPTRRQPAFITMTEGPAPNAKFVRRLAPTATQAFGPIAGTGQLRAAVDTLNQVFSLRDCPDKTRFEFNNQPTLFDNPSSAKCIRYELGTCPGPCASLCSAASYRANVDAAVQFLNGTDLAILEKLDQRMQAASARQSFETAVVLRDHLDNLTWLSRRLAALRQSQKVLNGVLPVAATRNRTAWLVLRGGQLLGSAVEPGLPERASAAEDFLTRIATAESRLPANIMEMNLQLIMISWFRRNPNLKKALLSFDEAIDQCRNPKSSSQAKADQKNARIPR